MCMRVCVLFLEIIYAHIPGVSFKKWLNGIYVTKTSISVLSIIRKLMKNLSSKFTSRKLQATENRGSQLKVSFQSRNEKI